METDEIRSTTGTPIQEHCCLTWCFKYAKTSGLQMTLLTLTLVSQRTNFKKYQHLQCKQYGLILGWRGQLYPRYFVPEATIEGLETQPLRPELFPQSCARLLDAASRVLIRNVVCCGNTNWTVFSEKFCVKRIWDQQSKHNKSYIIWNRITCRLQ